MKPLILPFSVLIVFLSGTLYAQQSDRDQYMSLYRAGQYDKALAVLKRVTKQDPTDGEAWYHLGLTRMGAGNDKEAVKALQKAVELAPNVADFQAGLSYAYLLRNDFRSSETAQKALKLSPRNLEAHYVLGVVSIRSEGYNMAYERAKKVIEINPSYANAYLLKYQALVSSFAIQSGTIVRPRNTRYELLVEAASDLEKYIVLQPGDPQVDFHRKNLESLKFFAEYYGRPENQGPIDLEPKTDPEPGKTPLKIISSPKAVYTERARQAGVQGAIRVLVGFSAEGTIKHILVIKSLGYGLDELSVRAAHQIRFQPATIDGKPVSSVKTFEYTFSIY